jgi:hypothetical protein
MAVLRASRLMLTVALPVVMSLALCEAIPPVDAVAGGGSVANTTRISSK